MPWQIYSPNGVKSSKSQGLLFMRILFGIDIAECFISDDAILRLARTVSVGRSVRLGRSVRDTFAFLLTQ